MAIEVREQCRECRGQGVVCRREPDVTTSFTPNLYSFTETYDVCDYCRGRGYVLLSGESEERIRPQNTMTVRVPMMYLHTYDSYDQTKMREAIQHYLPPSCFLREIVRHEFDTWNEMHVFEVTVSEERRPIVVPHPFDDVRPNRMPKLPNVQIKLPPAAPVPEEPKEQPKEVLGGTVRRILVMEEKKDDENGEEKK
jgi:excinuclease UvrABC ATPase subunit